MESSIPHERDPRSNMLSELTIALLNEDDDNFYKIIINQDVLGKIDIAEYLNVKRQTVEDPVEKIKWKSGLDKYLSTLAGHQFTEDENDRLKYVIQSIEFDAIVNNKVLAKEIVFKNKKVLEDELGDANLWDTSEFEPQFTDEDVQILRKLPAFNTAERLAKEGQFQAAKSAITSLPGRRGYRARKIIDRYVHLAAQQLAEEGHFQTAKSVISNYASGRESVRNMRKAMDKIVYLRATELAGGRQYNEASALVISCASSNARAAAMLKALGLR